MTGRPMFYNREGQPVDHDTWAALFEDSEGRRVAADSVGDVTVSTVWLGLDHNWSDTGSPLLFETMVFGGSHDGEQDRYTTEAEALAGHRAWVQRLGGAT